MDFFGTGWDVAERMGLTDDLRAIRYPIDDIDFVDADGIAYMHVPIDRLRRALDNRYIYLRRPDLERILTDRARARRRRHPLRHTIGRDRGSRQPCARHFRIRPG